MISIDLIPDTPIFTIQDLYDRQVAWFSQPDAELAYTFGQCVYHGETDDGTEIACAIGCAIPERLYHPEMEDRAFYTVNGREDVRAQQVVQAFRTELEGFFPLDDDLFLMYAKQSQQLHDDMASDQHHSVEDFLKRLDELAEQYDVRLRDVPGE